MSFTLAGDATACVGKGLSGGKLAIFPSAEAGFPAERNMIIGNVALYGATGREVFLRGLAGQHLAGSHIGVASVGQTMGATRP